MGVSEVTWCKNQASIIREKWIIKLSEKKLYNKKYVYQNPESAFFQRSFF